MNNFDKNDLRDLRATYFKSNKQKNSERIIHRRIYSNNRNSNDKFNDFKTDDQIKKYNNNDYRDLEICEYSSLSYIAGIPLSL